MCIFWIKSFHGEDCDIGGDISCIFYYNETFLSFRGEYCDIENTAPCFTYFFTAKMANFEYLSTLETVTRCGRYRTYLCKFFANLLRNCDSIRCVSFASKVNGIGYLSSDQDCDLMDSVSK